VVSLAVREEGRGRKGGGGRDVREGKKGKGEEGEEGRGREERGGGRS